jgi:signal peptidase II
MTQETPTRRMLAIATAVLLLDQLTKFLAVRFIEQDHGSIIIMDGFFKLVNWCNTGAAWSMFYDQNTVLAGISIAALIALIYWRERFTIKTITGQIAMSLIWGGIGGNLIDRLFRSHVVDFLRFYIYRRSGVEIGFPAFNVADTAICVGVGLLVIISLYQEEEVK